MRIQTSTPTNDLDIFSVFGKGHHKQSFRISNNCVIYTRVSTKEQAENLSLPVQKKTCQMYAQKHGYTVLEHFGGTYESARTDERKEFNRMLSFVKNCKEKVSYIIVYSVDRFSRSGPNAIYIASELKKKGILLVSVTQYADTSTSSGTLQQNVQFAFSSYENDQRREKTMAGTKEALLRGDWCTAPPTGYDIVRRNGKRMIVINEKGQLLKKAFLWKANNNLPIEEIRIRLKNLGLKLHHQRISVILRNPFYCGLIAHSALEGEVVQGNHEPLISKEIFLKVNNILAERAQGFKVIRENEDVPLKNFIKCGHCGESMPGYLVKAKGLWYYKCRAKGCCNNKSAKVLHQSFLNMLEPYTLNLSPEATEFVKKQLMKTISVEVDTKREEEVLLRKEITEINSKIDRLEERFVLEEITKEQYLKFTEKFKQEREEMYAQLSKCNIKVSNLDKAVEDFVTFSSKLPSLWTSSDYTTKQKLQKFIFPEGITYSKKNDECRTPKINPVFSYIARLTRGLAQNETGTIEDFSSDACLVASPGVEPESNV